MPMLFRSPRTRYLLAVVAVASGLVFVFGEPAKWQATPTFVFLRYVPVPMDTWGWIAVLYGLLLLFQRTKTGGYAVGAFLIAVVLVSLVVTLFTTGGPKNIFVILFAIDALVYHYLAIRFSTLDRFVR